MHLGIACPTRGTQSADNQLSTPLTQPLTYHMVHQTVVDTQTTRGLKNIETSKKKIGIPIIFGMTKAPCTWRGEPCMSICLPHLAAPQRPSGRCPLAPPRSRSSDSCPGLLCSPVMPTTLRIGVTVEAVRVSGAQMRMKVTSVFTRGLQ